MNTVKAQTHEGLETFNRTSDVETRYEMIGDAIDTLFTTGGLIKCGDTLYIVKIGQDYAIQDNEQDWKE